MTNNKINTFNELVKKCQGTFGKIEKEQYIHEFISNANGTEKNLLILKVNPDFISNFSEKMIKRAEQTSVSFISTVHDIVSPFTLLECLADRTFTGQRAIDVVARHLKHWSQTEKEDFITIATDASVGFSLDTVNEQWEKIHGKPLFKVFECQLANQYKPEKAKKYGKAFIESKKMDGIRCLCYNKNFHTRNNKNIEGFEFIIEEAQQIIEHFNLDFLDGELYSYEVPFAEIQGAVMRNKNIDEAQKRLISYNVFAAVNESILKIETSAMLSLLERIKEFVATNKLKHINIVEQTVIQNDPEVIKKKCIEYVEKGFEGVMLRSAEKAYDFKRSDALLKYKMFQEDDFVVKELLEGEGDLVGSLGKMVVSSKDGKITSKVGTGFKDDERLFFWNNPDEIIGKLVEIKFQEITEDGSLRFPVFCKVKEDR